MDDGGCDRLHGSGDGTGVGVKKLCTACMSPISAVDVGPGWSFPVIVSRIMFCLCGPPETKHPAAPLRGNGVIFMKQESPLAEFKI